MLSIDIPEGFAFDATGDTILDNDKIGGSGLEWVNASGSVPSFGKAVLVLSAPHWSSDAVKLRVELQRDDGGGVWSPRLADVWVGGGRPPAWIALPDKTFGVSVGRIQAVGSSGTGKVSAVVIVDAKQP